MASRHDIVSITFQANAGKANVALQALQSEAKKSSDRVKDLKAQLEAGLRANLPADQIQKIQADIKKAETEVKQWNKAYTELTKGVRTLDEAVKHFNGGTMGQMSAAFNKAAANAAKLAQTKMTPGTQEWKEMDALIVEAQSNVLKANTAINELTANIQKGGTASKSTLTQAKSDLQQLLTLEVRGSAEWNTYNKQLKVVEGELNKLAQAEQRAAQADQTAMMNKRMRDLKSLSSSALAETRRYWEQMIAGAERGSAELAKYEANLKKVQSQERQRTAASAESVLGNMPKFGIEQVRQAVQQMTQMRDSVQQGITAWQHYNRLVKEGEAYLLEYSEREKIARGEAMSLTDALKLSATAGKAGFTGTAQQLQLAEQAILKAANAAKKGSPEWTRYQEALAKVRVEMQNAGMTSERMRTILDKPANAKNLNELQAAVKRAKAELDLMAGTVGKNSKEYAQLAKQTKQAEFQLKEMQAQAKGTAGAFEKAWSRLKTYVGLYVGAAVAMQKVVATMGDLMELSDKMGEVRKTTGFTADEVGRLSESLKKLDTRTSLTSLMELSAAAGQLGLKTEEDVRGFTEAANMLMVALPEMGREGATEMMKVALATGEIDKIRQQMQQGLIEGSSATAVAMTKIGSTIDQLRANSAAAAPQITDFVKRVGAVGAQSGISIDQVAALGATVDALGMRVEMSATALSRMIPAIKNNSFAIGKAIGVTQSWIDEQFKMGNGMEVILKIFDHIREANMNADSIENLFGSSMQDIMKELNQQGARAGIVFAGLAQGVDQLRANLGIASEAYEDNIAIMREYVKMNDTTAAKWERLKNQFEEFFVGADSSKKVGYVIDALRALVDLLTGNVSGALKMVTGLLQTFIVYWGVLKIGLGEAVLYKAVEGLKAMGAGLVNLISNTKAAITYNRALAAAQKEVKVATDAVALAQAKQKVAAIEAEMAQKGLNKAMIANIWFALAAAILYVGMSLYDFYKKSSEAGKAMAKTRAEIEKAQYRFEGYYQKLEDTSKALRTAQTEHNKLSAEVDKLRKNTDGSAEATANLKKKEDELKVSENNLTRAKNEHRSAIAEMNQIYGKYLGFLLTEENYARMAAAAHEKVALAIEREMLLKQKQAAIENVKEKTSEDKQKDKIKYLDDLTRIGGLNERQVTQANKALNDFLTGKTSYNASKETTTFSSDVWNLFKSWGLDPSSMSASKLTALWFNKYLQDTFHLDPKSAERITGMRLRQTNGKVSKVETYYTGFSSNLRANYLDTYFKEQKNVGDVSRAHDQDLAGNAENLRNATVKLTNKLIADANASIKTINTKGKSAKEVDAAYGTLANSIVGLEEQILSLDQKKDAQEILRITKLIEDTQKRTDAKRLTQARDRARASLFEQATWQGDNTPTAPDMSSIGAPPPANPYGSYDPVKDPYTKWDADALVDRKKQMLEYVRALANGADVQSVLAKDEKFINDATKNNIKTTEQAIEWYNKERLKIEDALNAKHLTNEGNWHNPKKKKARELHLRAQWKASLDEIDAYYTERKTKIQEAATEEGVSEGEVWQRTLANEREWRSRRADLQKLYADKASEVSKEEADAIYEIIASRTGDSTDMVQKLIRKTIDFTKAIRDKNKNGQEEYRKFLSSLDLGAQRDYLKAQKTFVEQMKAIQAIIDKERPFNGITENLQENLAKMGILTADMQREREKLMKENADMSKFNERQAEQELKRTAFLLQEAENAYKLTAEQLMEDMRNAGFGDWADAIAKDDTLQRGLLAQLHQTFDAVQDAIKKESSLIKKQAEIAWNDVQATLTAIGPDGTTQKISIKQAYDSTLSALGLQKDQVSRANSLIGAGQASERVADKLAIKQMQVQLARQTHYYNLVRQTGLQRIADLNAAAKKAEALGNAEEAARLKLDAQHATMSLNLSLSEEQNKLDEQRVAIANQLEESQNRLYKELREWADLLYGSLQSIFEASNTGQADYYNEIAKLRLTGDTGGGTYVVIDNAGTSKAEAHYETYATEEEHLRRQLEIDQQNAVAEAWRKVMDDINQKMNDMITYQLNAMFQNKAIDDNTEATWFNTNALNALNEQLAQGISVNGTAVGSDATLPEIDENDPSTWPRAMRKRAGLPVNENPHDHTQEIQEIEIDPVAAAMKMIELQNAVTENKLLNDKKELQSETNKGSKMAISSQSTFAKMIAAANLYGAAYQAMSNDNMDMAQKFEMIALQAVGNAAIAGLQVALSQGTAETAANMPAAASKASAEEGPIMGPILFAVLSALVGGLMGLAASKVAKSKSQIAQITGASSSAGRLSTGMLTYAEGNVNEFTDPDTLIPGRQYNVDAADGRTYRARYTGRNPRTHLTNGPEFHLAGERGREMIIDARTTRQITMDESGIWHAIQTLSGGGSLRAMRRAATRRRGVAAFADGNIEDFEDMVSMDGVGSGVGPDMLAALKASLDRNSEVMERAVENGIKGVFNVYGKGGLVDSYDTGKKTVNRHGERY